MYLRKNWAGLTERQQCSQPTPREPKCHVTRPLPPHRKQWLPILSLTQPMQAVVQGGDREPECPSPPWGEQGFKNRQSGSGGAWVAPTQSLTHTVGKEKCPKNWSLGPNTPRDAQGLPGRH